MHSKSLLQTAICELAVDAVNRFVKDSQCIGLGSGSPMAVLIKEISKSVNMETLKFTATSLQIKIEAEKYGLDVVDENSVRQIDLVFDGADQIDSDFNMIKGGGGALSKEKILIYAAKKVIIIADSSKFVDAFNRTIPIEVHQFARSFVGRKLYEIGTAPTLRTLEKGYPYITESGNIIFDTQFGSFKDPQRREIEVKSIPGVLEVGLFTRRADVYYKAKFDGSFETLMF